MDINVTYEPTVDELRRGVKLALRRERLRFWVFSVCVAVVGVVCLALGALEYGAYFIVLAGVVALILTAGQNRAVAKQAVRLCRPTRVNLTDEQMRLETDLVKTEASWNNFAKVGDTETFLLLYVTKRQVFVIPKRAFTPTQAAELATFVTDRVASSQHTAKPVR